MTIMLGCAADGELRLIWSILGTVSMAEDLLEQLPNTARWPSIVVVFTVRSVIYQLGVSLISTNSY